MLIAVEGCTHGALDKIYETLDELEKENNYKIDLLICCGDFQATRNLPDLKCMACPDKYKEMCSFYKYYAGEKIAPLLTIFIGGNHEASNYMQELPYGGWVARNIYYMGYASVIKVNNLRIGGMSGIFSGYDYLTGHHEIPPYNQSTQRSVYHLRNLEVFRLKQMSKSPPDIMLSHDWPKGIHKFGNCAQLLRFKKFLSNDIEKDALGSRPTMEVLEKLKPEFWFSAHLHVKFAALVPHSPRDDEDMNKVNATKFLSLDKCLPRRRFLQVLELGEPKMGEKLRLEYDPAWLAILKSTNHLLSVKTGQNHMPGPISSERFDFSPTVEEIEDIHKIFENDFTIPENFEPTAKCFNVRTQNLGQLRMTRLPSPRQNPQTVEICRKLRISDPVDLILEGHWPESDELEAAAENKDFIQQRNEEEKLDLTSFPSFIVDNDSVDISENKSFTIDTTPGITKDENEIELGDEDDEEEQKKPEQEEVKESPVKKLKRRNASIYTNTDD